MDSHRSNTTPPNLPTPAPTPLSGSTFPSDPPPSRSRHAAPTHTPPIPLAHRWRCCRNPCAHANLTTTPAHFVPWFSFQERRPIWAPGYFGTGCAACRHLACDACCFLDVFRVDGTRESACVGNERSPWDAIGYWDRREDFGDDDVVGLRTSDEAPPGTMWEWIMKWEMEGR